MGAPFAHTFAWLRFVEEVEKMNPHAALPASHAAGAPPKKKKKPVIKEMMRDSRMRSTNMKLQQSFQCLKHEREKDESLFGFGVNGTHDMFPKLVTFLDKCKRTSHFKDTGTLPPLYFASVDIHHCYDTINQKSLYELVKSVMSEDQYVPRTFVNQAGHTLTLYSLASLTCTRPALTLALLTLAGTRSASTRCATRTTRGARSR